MEPKPRISPIASALLSPPAQKMEGMVAQSMANLPNAPAGAYNDEMKRQILRAMLAGQRN